MKVITNRVARLEVKGAERGRNVGRREAISNDLQLKRKRGRHEPKEETLFVILGWRGERGSEPVKLDMKGDGFISPDQVATERGRSKKGTRKK